MSEHRLTLVSLGKEQGTATDRVPIDIVFLIAAHNRRTRTLSVLGDISSQESSAGLRASTVVVDDGSTDGTADAIAEHFPYVCVIPGDGTLYWARAMHLAQVEALRRAAPAYLCWLNDDISLVPHAIRDLLALANIGPGRIVAVGSLTDPSTGAVTYTGMRRSGRRPLQLELVNPAGAPQSIDTFNGNVVLIPRDIYLRVGAVDPAFEHAWGDIDYGYRVGEAGFKAMLAGAPVGTCARGGTKAPWLDERLSATKRIRVLFGTKGIPVRSQIHFFRRHGGSLWPVLATVTYVRAIVSILRDSILSRVAATKLAGS